MFACLLAHLPAWDLIINLFYGCEEFETFTYTVFQTVLFFSICTDLLYRYYFPVFVPISIIDTVFLYYDTQ